MRAPIPEFKESGSRSAVSSMVDIAFLLLIFFLVATTLVPSERDLPMELPKPNGQAMSLKLPVWIEITDGNAVNWGEGSATMEVATADSGSDLPDLRASLEAVAAAAGAEEVGVVLKVDDSATQQRFTDVLNCLAACGIEQVSLVDFKLK